LSVAVIAAASTFGLVVEAAYADPGPTIITPPSIAGVAQQGVQLTADPGTWSGDPITFTYLWSDGTTANTDVPSAADVGQDVSVIVTATNDAGTVSQTVTTGPVLPAAPVLDAAGPSPTITGTAEQGDTLSVSDGNWDNDPTGFNYVWEDCNSTGTVCAPISGAASSPTYAVQSTDVGSTIEVVVTASNAGGQSSATSNGFGPVLPAAPVSQTSGPPTISGVAQQGDTLTVTNNGTWSNSPTGFGYVWEDCASGSCAPISGAASSSTYMVQSTDVGSTIEVVVTASNSGGQGAATSNGLGPVLPATPVNSKAPVLSGTAQQGDTLTVTSNGSWSNSPTGFSYVWEDCNTAGTVCAPISGAASSSTYTVQSTDVGSAIEVIVTASNAGGGNPATSNSTKTVLPAAPAVTGAPGIGGTPQQGDTLTATNGTWNNNPTKFTYAWEDCDSSGNCSAISGATAKTYKLATTDVGKLLSVTVTASNSGGAAAVTSAPVGPVLPPAPANTSAPQITVTPAGTPEQGDTLSVSNGTWSNAATFTYAWEECDGSGNNCSPIPGATSSSYTLSAADIGDTITCVVTATGPGGSTPANSNKTATVVAAPTPAASQPTTTSLLSSPAAAVTNQGVTLIATVTSSSSSSTALWGTVTFDDGAAAINGCVNTAVTPSGQSATVACSTSFAASTAQLTAVFTPTAGSVLKGSASPADALVVGPDTTTTSLDAMASVSVGSSTTFTASVAPPAARLGPVEPSGSVEFLDGGQPIASCAGQALSAGQATCTVAYAAAGAHQITARYIGDPNFTGSTSQAESVSAVPLATDVLGTITSTMQWAFYYTPSYTQVRALVVNGVLPGATVLVKCHGKGCPFAHHSTLLGKRAQCGKKKKAMCSAYGSFQITPGFASHHLGLGSRVTVEIIRPSWVGKFYSFTVRSRQGPRIQIGCLAPGGSVPGQGC
jgi:hypothetical protein